MILSDNELLERGPSLLDPFDRSMVQPASVDLHLSQLIVIPQDDDIDVLYDYVIDPTHLNMAYIAQDGPYRLRSQELVLASTVERIMVPPDLVARVEGKSSLARIGLFVHITAGFCDPGFEGNITLEVYNVNKRPIMLVPDMKICQITFDKLTSPADRPYGSPGLNSHYQNQQGVVVSRYGQ